MTEPKIIKISKSGEYRIIWSDHYKKYKVQRKGRGCWRQIAEYNQEINAIRFMEKWEGCL